MSSPTMSHTPSTIRWEPLCCGLKCGWCKWPKKPKRWTERCLNGLRRSAELGYYIPRGFIISTLDGFHVTWSVVGVQIIYQCICKEVILFVYLWSCTGKKPVKPVTLGLVSDNAEQHSAINSACTSPSSWSNWYQCMILAEALTLWVCCPCSRNPEPHTFACCLLSRCLWPRLVRCSLFLFSYRQGTASAAGIFEALWKQVHITLFFHTLFVNQCNCNTELTELVSDAFSHDVLSLSPCVCDNQRSWVSGFGFKQIHTASVLSLRRRKYWCVGYTQNRLI